MSEITEIVPKTKKTRPPMTEEHKLKMKLAKEEKARQRIADKLNNKKE